MMAQNSLMMLQPYYDGGTWVFDDAQTGLVREPFVIGIPEMIDILVADIPDSRKGFRMLFSAAPFPGYQAKLDLLREEYGGNWYRWEAKQLEGWLCPALFQYFPAAPPELYCRAEPIQHGS